MTMSDVWHYDGLVYWSPISEDKMEMLLDMVPLGSGDHALDIGCGCGEILLRLVERYGVSATGIDRSSSALEVASEAIARRAHRSQIKLIETDINELSADPESYGFISSLGGPRIGTSYRDTLRALGSWLRPGGYLLMGELFWAKQPDPEYLEATGLPTDGMNDHWGNMQAGRDEGLTPLFACVSNRDEWDAFEGRILYNVELRAEAYPTEPGLQDNLQHRRAWWEAQQRWGRDTMGFGLYLFRRGPTWPDPL